MNFSSPTPSVSEEIRNMFDNDDFLPTKSSSQCTSEIIETKYENIDDDLIVEHNEEVTYEVVGEEDISKLEEFGGFTVGHEEGVIEEFLIEDNVGELKEIDESAESHDQMMVCVEGLVCAKPKNCEETIEYSAGELKKNIVPCPENSHCSSLESGSLLRKKRKRNPELWKSNIRKRQRESGQQYISINNKEVPAKSLKPPCTDCHFNCANIFIAKERLNIFKLFWSLTDNEKRSFYFKFVKRYRVKRRKKSSQENKQFTFKYYFEKNQTIYRVCRVFFLNTLCINQKRIYYYFQTLQNKSGCPVEEEVDEFAVGEEEKLISCTENPICFPSEIGALVSKRRKKNLELWKSNLRKRQRKSKQQDISITKNLEDNVVKIEEVGEFAGSQNKLSVCNEARVCEEVSISKESVEDSFSQVEEVIVPYPENPVCTHLETEALLTKKRKKNLDLWKNNIRKKKRKSRQQYISIKKKVVQAKTLKPPCSGCCFNCASIFTAKERLNIFKLFWSLTGKEKKSFYLKFVIRYQVKRRRTNSREKIKQFTFNYYFEKNQSLHRVCRVFFLNTLGIDQKRIYYCFQNLKNESAPPKEDNIEDNFVKNEEVDDFAIGQESMACERMRFCKETVENSIGKLENVIPCAENPICFPSETVFLLTKENNIENNIVKIEKVDEFDVSPEPLLVCNEARVCEEVKISKESEEDSISQVEKVIVRCSENPVCSPSGSKALTKKRKKNLELWKTNIRKKQRKSGKQYISTKKKEVPAKSLKPPCIGCCFNCANIFTAQERLNIFKSFWSLTDKEKKNFYFKFVIRDQVKRRRTNSRQYIKQFTFNYYFEKNQSLHRVCRVFFINTLSIDQKRIYYCFQNFKYKSSPLIEYNIEDIVVKNEEVDDFDVGKESIACEKMRVCKETMENSIGKLEEIIIPCAENPICFSSETVSLLTKQNNIEDNVVKIEKVDEFAVSPDNFLVCKEERVCEEVSISKESVENSTSQIEKVIVPDNLLVCKEERVCEEERISKESVENSTSQIEKVIVPCLENPVCSPSESEALLTKKRKKNLELRKTNIGEKQRKSGKQYIPTKKKEVQAKSLKPPCVGCCFNCANIFTAQERLNIFKSFWSLTDKEKKSFYFKFVIRDQVKRRRTKSKENLKQFTFTYYFEKNQSLRRVCRVFFLNTLSIDQKRIYYCFQNFKNKSSPPIEDNIGNDEFSVGHDEVEVCNEAMVCKDVSTCEETLEDCVVKLEEVIEPDYTLCASSESESLLTKKRKNNRIGKGQRKSGEKYISLNKKEVPAKSLKPPCNDCCFNCLNTFTTEERLNIFELFWSLTEKEKKSFYFKFVVRDLVKRHRKYTGENIEQFTFKYYFEKDQSIHQVCRIFFLNTLSIDQERIYYCFKNLEIKSGSPIEDNNVKIEEVDGDEMLTYDDAMD